MALLICPECNGKVSDKAPACPHCGCPIDDVVLATQKDDQVDNGTICVVDNIPHDLAMILDLAKQGDDEMTRGMAYEILCMNKPSIIDTSTDDCIEDFRELWGEIYRTGKIPPSFTSRRWRKKSKAADNDKPTANTPRCPTCGSTSLTKLGIAHRAIDGFFFGQLSVEGRAQFRCNKCGYMW